MPCGALPNFVSICILVMSVAIKYCLSQSKATYCLSFVASFFHLSVILYYQILQAAQVFSNVMLRHIVDFQ